MVGLPGILGNSERGYEGQLQKEFGDAGGRLRYSYREIQCGWDTSQILVPCDGIQTVDPWY